MSCQICLEDYKGRKKPITCQYCPSNACSKCLERYFLQSYEDPCCVDCKRGWSSDFIAANFTLTFRNGELRKHRRDVLFEREKSLLPAMQVFAAARTRHRQLVQERIELFAGFEGPDTLSDKHRRAQIEQYTLEIKAKDKEKIIVALENEITTFSTPEKVAYLASLKKEQEKLLAQAKKIHTDSKGIRDAFRARQKEIRANSDKMTAAMNEYNGTNSAPERREFIMKCCADGCRGFLSTAYKCGTCESRTCPDCLVVLGKEKNVAHTCAPDAVESTKLIRNETIPCPKCATRIYKVDGCNQMWCVMEGCNTAFDWVSGRIITGAVHNPHYYEWLRRTGGQQRETGDIPCGGIPTYWVLLSAFRVARIVPAETEHLEQVQRMLVEMEERLAHYPTRMPQLINKESNVAYLLQDIGEDQWKKQLESTETKFNRKKEIGLILHTLVMAAADTINQVVNRCNAALTTELRIELRLWITETVMPQLDALRTYTNQALKDLAIRNHMAVPQVSDTWTWIPIRAIYKKTSINEVRSEIFNDGSVAPENII